jgi:hypothetical protein
MPSPTAGSGTQADALRAEAARLAEMIGDLQLAALAPGVPPAVVASLAGRFARLRDWLREQLDGFEAFAVVWDERPLNHHPEE